MLQPRIEILEFKPRDITGFYPANPNGWGSPNLDRSEIQHAKILVRFNQQPFMEIDVTDQVKVSSDEIIEFPAIENKADGVYKAYYQVDELTSFGALFFVHDQIKEDISKMWAALACCYDTYVYRQWAKECIWMDTHERMLGTFTRRGMEKDYLNTMRIMQARIETNKKEMPCQKV